MRLPAQRAFGQTTAPPSPPGAVSPLHAPWLLVNPPKAACCASIAKRCCNRPAIGCCPCWCGRSAPRACGRKSLACSWRAQLPAWGARCVSNHPAHLQKRPDRARTTPSARLLCGRGWGGGKAGWLLSGRRTHLLSECRRSPFGRGLARLSRFRRTRTLRSSAQCGLRPTTLAWPWNPTRNAIESPQRAGRHASRTLPYDSLNIADTPTRRLPGDYSAERLKPNRGAA